MSQHSPQGPQTPPERIEAHLRAEAMVLRRPAPAGLRAAVMARIQGDPLPLPSVAPRARSRPLWRPRSGSRGRVFALAGLAAAALVLALLRGIAPTPAALDPGADGPGPIGRIANLFEASRLAHAQAFEGTELERPLLAELEALGQDTARAAATLARELPGPVGRLFR